MHKSPNKLFLVLFFPYRSTNVIPIQGAKSLPDVHVCFTFTKSQNDWFIKKCRSNSSQNKSPGLYHFNCKLLITPLGFTINSFCSNVSKQKKSSCNITNLNFVNVCKWQSPEISKNKFSSFPPSDFCKKMIFSRPLLRSFSLEKLSFFFFFTY